MPSPQNDTLFKILAHPQRAAILRRLMSAQATLTQLGESFDKSPAHIRHHLKVLESAGLVEFVESRRVQGGPEKYYRAARKALMIHQAVLPEIPDGKIGLTIGSMDSGIRHLAGYFSGKDVPFSLQPVPLSSLDGLIAQRQGLCHMSTCHLIDSQSADYNIPFVRHLFPGRQMALVRIYRREEGLIVPSGNPQGIHSLEDMARPDVRFVNREAGSGVRQWVDLHLERLGIPPEVVRGYAHEVRSHNSVARAVHESRADTGIGIAASAQEFGLDFVPLFEEPYDLVVPIELTSEDQYQPFFEVLNSGDFRAVVRNLGGYSVPQSSGELVIVN